MHRWVQKLEKVIFLFITSFISASVVFFTSLASFPAFYTKDRGSGQPRTEQCSPFCAMLFPTLNSIQRHSCLLCMWSLSPALKRQCGDQHYPRESKHLWAPRSHTAELWTVQVHHIWSSGDSAWWNVYSDSSLIRPKANN